MSMDHAFNVALAAADAGAGFLDSCLAKSSNHVMGGYKDTGMGGQGRP